MAGTVLAMERAIGSSSSSAVLLELLYNGHAPRALLLGEAAAQGRGIDLSANRESGRDGMTGARKEGAIGFAALRGGTVAGDHSVILAGNEESITLSHHAENRMIFARGAVKAAEWLIGKQAGRYTMNDVLGL